MVEVTSKIMTSMEIFNRVSLRERVELEKET